MEEPISVPFEPATCDNPLVSTTCFKGSEQLLSIHLLCNIHNFMPPHPHSEEFLPLI